MTNRTFSPRQFMGYEANIAAPAARRARVEENLLPLDEHAQISTRESLIRQKLGAVRGSVSATTQVLSELVQTPGRWTSDKQIVAGALVQLYGAESAVGHWRNLQNHMAQKPGPQPGSFPFSAAVLQQNKTAQTKTKKTVTPPTKPAPTPPLVLKDLRDLQTEQLTRGLGLGAARDPLLEDLDRRIEAERWNMTLRDLRIEILRKQELRRKWLREMPKDGYWVAGYQAPIEELLKETWQRIRQHEKRIADLGRDIDWHNKLQADWEKQDSRTEPQAAEKLAQGLARMEQEKQQAKAELDMDRFRQDRLVVDLSCVSAKLLPMFYLFSDASALKPKVPKPAKPWGAERAWLNISSGALGAGSFLAQFLQSFYDYSPAGLVQHGTESTIDWIANKFGKTRPDRGPGLFGEAAEWMRQASAEEAYRATGDTVPTVGDDLLQLTGYVLVAYFPMRALGGLRTPGLAPRISQPLTYGMVGALGHGNEDLEEMLKAGVFFALIPVAGRAGTPIKRIVMSAALGPAYTYAKNLPWREIRYALAAGDLEAAMELTQDPALLRQATAAGIGGFVLAATNEGLRARSGTNKTRIKGKTAQDKSPARRYMEEQELRQFRDELNQTTKQQQVDELNRMSGGRHPERAAGRTPAEELQQSLSADPDAQAAELWRMMNGISGGGGEETAGGGVGRTNIRPGSNPRGGGGGGGTRSGQDTTAVVDAISEGIGSAPQSTGPRAQASTQTATPKTSTTPPRGADASLPPHIFYPSSETTAAPDPKRQTGAPTIGTAVPSVGLPPGYKPPEFHTTPLPSYVPPGGRLYVTRAYDPSTGQEIITGWAIIYSRDEEKDLPVDAIAMPAQTAPVPAPNFGAPFQIQSTTSSGPPTNAPPPSVSALLASTREMEKFLAEEKQQLEWHRIPITNSLWTLLFQAEIQFSQLRYYNQNINQLQSGDNSALRSTLQSYLAIRPADQNAWGSLMNTQPDTAATGSDDAESKSGSSFVAVQTPKGRTVWLPKHYFPENVRAMLVFSTSRQRNSGATQTELIASGINNRTLRDQIKKPLPIFYAIYQPPGGVGTSTDPTLYAVHPYCSWPIDEEVPTAADLAVMIDPVGWGAIVEYQRRQLAQNKSSFSRHELFHETSTATRSDRILHAFNNSFQTSPFRQRIRLIEESEPEYDPTERRFQVKVEWYPSEGLPTSHLLPQQLPAVPRRQNPRSGGTPPFASRTWHRILAALDELGGSGTLAEIAAVAEVPQAGLSNYTQGSGKRLPGLIKTSKTRPFRYRVNPDIVTAPEVVVGRMEDILNRIRSSKYGWLLFDRTYKRHFGELYDQGKVGRVVSLTRTGSYQTFYYEIIEGQSAEQSNPLREFMEEQHTIARRLYFFALLQDGQISLQEIELMHETPDGRRLGRGDIAAYVPTLFEVIEPGQKWLLKGARNNVVASPEVESKRTAPPSLPPIPPLDPAPTPPVVTAPVPQPTPVTKPAAPTPPPPSPTTGGSASVGGHGYAALRAMQERTKQEDAAIEEAKEQGDEVTERELALLRIKKLITRWEDALDEGNQGGARAASTTLEQYWEDYELQYDFSFLFTTPTPPPKPAEPATKPAKPILDPAKTAEPKRESPAPKFEDDLNRLGQLAGIKPETEPTEHTLAERFPILTPIARELWAKLVNEPLFFFGTTSLSSDSIDASGINMHALHGRSQSVISVRVADWQYCRESFLAIFGHDPLSEQQWASISPGNMRGSQLNPFLLYGRHSLAELQAQREVDGYLAFAHALKEAVDTASKNPRFNDRTSRLIEIQSRIVDRPIEPIIITITGAAFDGALQPNNVRDGGVSYSAAFEGRGGLGLIELMLLRYQAIHGAVGQITPMLEQEILTEVRNSFRNHTTFVRTVARTHITSIDKAQTGDRKIAVATIGNRFGRPLLATILANIRRQEFDRQKENERDLLLRKIRSDVTRLDARLLAVFTTQVEHDELWKLLESYKKYADLTVTVVIGPRAEPTLPVVARPNLNLFQYTREQIAAYRFVVTEANRLAESGKYDTVLIANQSNRQTLQTAIFDGVTQFGRAKWRDPLALDAQTVIDALESAAPFKGEKGVERIAIVGFHSIRPNVEYVEKLRQLRGAHTIDVWHTDLVGRFSKREPTSAGTITRSHKPPELVRLVLSATPSSARAIGVEDVGVDPAGVAALAKQMEIQQARYIRFLLGAQVHHPNGFTIQDLMNHAKHTRVQTGLSSTDHREELNALLDEEKIKIVEEGENTRFILLTQAIPAPTTSTGQSPHIIKAKHLEVLRQLAQQKPEGFTVKDAADAIGDRDHKSGYSTTGHQLKSYVEAGYLRRERDTSHTRRRRDIYFYNGDINTPVLAVESFDSQLHKLQMASKTGWFKSPRYLQPSDLEKFQLIQIQSRRLGQRYRKRDFGNPIPPHLQLNALFTTAYIIVIDKIELGEEPVVTSKNIGEWSLDRDQLLRLQNQGEFIFEKVEASKDIRLSEAVYEDLLRKNPVAVTGPGEEISQQIPSDISIVRWHTLLQLDEQSPEGFTKKAAADLQVESTRSGLSRTSTKRSPIIVPKKMNVGAGNRATYTIAPMFRWKGPGALPDLPTYVFLFEQRWQDVYLLILGCQAQGLPGAPAAIAQQHNLYQAMYNYLRDGRLVYQEADGTYSIAANWKIDLPTGFTVPEINIVVPNKQRPAGSGRKRSSSPKLVAFAELQGTLPEGKLTWAQALTVMQDSALITYHVRQGNIRKEKIGDTNYYWVPEDVQQVKPADRQSQIKNFAQTTPYPWFLGNWIGKDFNSTCNQYSKSNGLLVAQHAPIVRGHTFYRLREVPDPILEKYKNDPHFLRLYFMAILVGGNLTTERLDHMEAAPGRPRALGRRYTADDLERYPDVFRKTENGWFLYAGRKNP